MCPRPRGPQRMRQEACRARRDGLVRRRSDRGCVHLGHAVHSRASFAAERSHLGEPRVALGAAGGSPLRGDGGAHPLAVPPAQPGMAAVRVQLADRDLGCRRLHALGAGGRRTRIRLLGSRHRLGVSAHRVARVRGLDLDLPHLPHRAPAVASMAVGGVDHPRRRRSPHGRHLHHPPRNLHPFRPVRRVHAVHRLVDGRLPPRRRRPSRLRCLPGSPPAQGHRRRASTTSVGDVLSRVLGGRRRGRLDAPPGSRCGGNVAGRAAVEVGPACRPGLRGCGGAASPSSADRADRQPRLVGGTGNGAHRRRLRARCRGGRLRVG